VLEVGCGTGNTLRVLEHACTRGTVIGMDLYDEGLRIARRRVRCELVQGDIGNIPVPGDFDLIGAFDVLEHLPDDARALRDLRQRLCPGGRLLLTVPAHMTLWSYADDAAHHCRRYAPDQLRQVLEDAGYTVEYLTQFMSVIYPLVWAGRRIAARQAGRAAGERAFELLSRELRVVPVWNELLSWLLAMELPRLRAQKAVPFGTSLLAIAVSGSRP
jgi:SAM-dependent methyltransferase